MKNYKNQTFFLVSGYSYKCFVVYILWVMKSNADLKYVTVQ